MTLLFKSFKNIYQQEKLNRTFFKLDEDGTPKASSALFLRFLIGILPETKFYLRSLDTFFQFFYSLIRIDRDIIQFLLSKKLMGRLGYYFDNPIMESDGKFKEFKEGFEDLVSDLPIRIDDEITNDPRKDTEEDFENAYFTDLSKFFKLLWELMRYSSIPDRDDYASFSYHKNGINYKLTPLECQIFDLNLSKIEKMFSYVNQEDKKSRLLVCKIIAFLNFGSFDGIQISSNFVANSLKEGAAEKSMDETLSLVKILGKLKDNYQDNRVKK